MNIIEKLKKLNVGVTPEIEKELTGEFFTEKEMEKFKTENEILKEKARTSEELIKNLDGKNLDEIIKERDDWKKKAEEAERLQAEQEKAKEKQRLLDEAFKGVEFTSNSAKKSIVARISENISVKDGKLIGFNDLLEEIKKEDASAFVNTEQEELERKKAKFTGKMENTQGEYVDKTDLGKLSMYDYIKARRK